MTGLIREIEHCWIPVPDGVRLAARLWLPVSADSRPVPALFEYIPYRKDDMVRARDERNHPYFAAHGYACIRVDMRGSGDSEGQMADMYTPAELADARHVIDWIAAQRWCNGSVGMFGTSWGGVAGLQAGIDAPPALKAVIAVCATHDRFGDDIHHEGGCLLTDSIQWGATLPVILASPPSPLNVGESWRDAWLERLENSTFPLERWTDEQTRSGYWKWGSAIDRLDRLDVPVLAIGGWSDRYSNSVMSLLERRPDSVWGIVGPWGHHYPDVASPGPGIGFQQEALLWWDHWLKGSGDLRFPKLRVWLREFDEPVDMLESRNGQWVEFTEPPGRLTEAVELFPQREDRLAGHRGSGEAEVPFDLSVGSAAGDTGYFGRPGGLPLDQGIDDSNSLFFQGESLEAPLILLGAVELLLEVVCDQPLAQLCVRVGDVGPDGRVCRVVQAVRNLTLDDSFEEERPLVPGKPRRVRMRLPMAAYMFHPGHSIRIAFSASCWPLTWPAPRPVRLKLILGGCRISLPCLHAGDYNLAQTFPAPEQQPRSFRTLADGPLERIMRREAGGRIESGWHQPFTCQYFPATGTSFGYETSAEHAIDDTNPLSAQSRFTHRHKLERKGWSAEIIGSAEITATAEVFEIEGSLDAYENDRLIFSRRWSPRVARRIG